MEIIYRTVESSPENWAYIQELASHTIDEQMLPLTEEKMLSNTLACVALWKGDVIGYAAQTAYYPASKTAEVGSLIVDPLHRGNGIGSELIRRTTALIVVSGAHGSQDINDIMAFCNPKSASIFKKQGFTHVSLTEVPPESLFECAKCPKKCFFPLGECCDKAYIYVDDPEDKVE